MPAMYPEALRSLREQNPGLQYDFRGNLIDDGGYGESLQGWSPYKPDYGMQNPYGNLLQDVSNLFYKPDNVVDQDWNTYYRQQFGAGDALSRAVQGLDGFNYRPDGGEQSGPSLPGMPRPGQHLTLPEPNAGFYSQWNPGTNSWVRHGSPSDGGGFAASRPRASAGAGGDPYNLRGWSPYRQNSQSAQLPEDLQYGLV